MSELHCERIVLCREDYGPERLAEDVRELASRHSFVSAGSIGRSALNKPIHEIGIGAGPFRWHFNGACHANEWITTLLLMRFAEDFAVACGSGGLIGGKSARELYDRCSLRIVPMVNPDGVELVQGGLTPDHPYYDELLEWNKGARDFRDWKANARGVDLNDQFPAYWDEERKRRGVAGPGPRDYVGAGPLVEPEAQALAEWTVRLDFHAVIALHTQGEEIYWNYRDLEPPESAGWARRLALASGYRDVYLEGSDAGYKDWFIAKFRRPGFTVEAGLGQNPLPLNAFEHIYADVAKLLAEALSLSPE